jgi:hypothetical protein
VVKTFYKHERHIVGPFFHNESIVGGGSDVASVFSCRRDRFIIHRFDKDSIVAGKSYDMETPDSISFIVSHHINLLAILFYGSCGEVAEYNIHLEIFEDLGGMLSM